MTTVEKVQPRLKARYRSEIRDALNNEFRYANVMQIPGVVKVVAELESASYERLWLVDTLVALRKT